MNTDELFIERYYEQVVDTPGTATNLAQIIGVLFSASAFASALVAGSTTLGMDSPIFVLSFFLALLSVYAVAYAITVPSFTRLRDDRQLVKDSGSKVFADSIDQSVKAQLKKMVLSMRVGIGLAVAAQALLVVGLGLASADSRARANEPAILYIKNGDAISTIQGHVCAPVAVNDRIVVVKVRTVLESPDLPGFLTARCDNSGGHGAERISIHSTDVLLVKKTTD